MNYQRIYNNIIELSKSRKLTEYKEKHHIIPKCMNGTNNKSNIAILTAREHFICHMLLCEIYPDNNKLNFALWCMTNYHNDINQNRYKVTARVYDRLKTDIAKIKSSFFSGENNPMYGKNVYNIWINKYGKQIADEKLISSNNKKSIQSTGENNPIYGTTRPKNTRDKISKSCKGREVWNNGISMNDETKKKISISKTGKPMKDETKKKISNSKKGKPAHNKGKPSPMKGKPRSEETKKRMSKSLKGKIPWNKGKKIKGVL
jgi:hypothetical protein